MDRNDGTRVAVATSVRQLAENRKGMDSTGSHINNAHKCTRVNRFNGFRRESASNRIRTKKELHIIHTILFSQQ